ncbi:DUF2255 family protein [Subtercola sp. YIM 133946]|uniref:DUF2255 family protein n=1 Tax=Subtercola sp. YIM 133946 TaxID=3118909 RepID=UPI002F92FB7A
MPDAWSPGELELIDRADELEIAPQRPDGRRMWVPIWVVRVDGDVYLRTWHRRDTGWFGRAVSSQRARIRVPGLEREVRVDDVGVGDERMRAGIDAAYTTKYGRYGGATVDRMTNDDAAAATLRMVALSDAR